jgi:hypothetical protein
MADEDLTGPSGCPSGHRVGGWVIRFPAVVRTVALSC